MGAEDRQRQAAVLRGRGWNPSTDFNLPSMHCKFQVLSHPLHTILAETGEVEHDSYLQLVRKKCYSYTINTLIKVAYCQVGTLENLAPAVCLSKGL